ncbi:MAG TPA: hypothetical protein P5205_20045 [Candidatus Paceibacterota bacterium]|nr:hypothetical protein [Verrucomicrobiota bacterium]HSA12658.1 hypothetical protein [Candidatus Paceibacterota bacterium]
MRLTESDLKFVVQTVATLRRDHDNILSLVRDKDDLLELMLEDPKLAERLLAGREVFVHVSPYLTFAVLLRRIQRDLEGQSFLIDRDARGRSIPVFEARRAVQLLKDPSTREYLTEMLCSFVRTNTGMLYWKGHGAWHKRRISDMDMDDMIALCNLAEPAFKPRLYRRIADIALFLTGIYPDHASSAEGRARGQAARRRTVPDYEREGRRFYALAARAPEPPWSASVFEGLAEQFTLAREALTALSDRYLKPLRDRYFDLAAN